jgi:hypothetical protein
MFSALSSGTTEEIRFNHRLLVVLLCAIVTVLLGWQATRLPGRISRARGFSLRQSAVAAGQRGWKRQPFGGVIKPGILPGMPCGRRSG